MLLSWNRVRHRQKRASGKTSGHAKATWLGPGLQHTGVAIEQLKTVACRAESSTHLQGLVGRGVHVILDLES
jgi:hypothetical protein